MNMADNNKTLMIDSHLVLSYYNIIASNGHSRLQRQLESPRWSSFAADYCLILH